MKTDLINFLSEMLQPIQMVLVYASTPRLYSSYAKIRKVPCNIIFNTDLAHW